MSVSNYLSLIRLKNQIGTVLLFIPCVLGLLFCKGLNAQTFFLFLASAFLARSCGCILNDIADQKIDTNTPATNHRPLASNKLTKKQALSFFGILVCLGMPLLFFYSKSIFIPLGIVGTLVGIYPYSKRFFPIPQLFLGLAYSSGFLIAIVNHFEVPITYLHPKVWLLYSGLTLWVIIFDTIYAKRDYQSDITNNIKSSTIFFARHFKASILGIIAFITLCATGLYTCFLTLIIIPFAASVIYNMQKQKEEAFRKINFVLIYLILLNNIAFSVAALTPLHYALLGINTIIQCISVFIKPSHGFKLNTLCIIPLSLLFLV